MVLSESIEEYIKNMISFSLGLTPPSPKFLLEKLQQAEEQHERSEAQIFALQQRLLDLEHRLTQTKEEASMNAIALRRNIAEKERLEAELRQTLERCAWLEEECSLYLKDREVFRDVADDAEEKASQVEKKLLKTEERCTLVEMEAAQLLAETQEFKRIQMENNDEIMRLGCKIEQLQTQNSNLQAELVKAEKQLVESDALKDQFLQNNKIPKEDCICKQWQGPQELMAEIQRLWKENYTYKINLEKAEARISLIQNRDIKSTHRNRSIMISSSPVAKKGRFTMNMPQNNKSNSSESNDSRQPLGFLESNVINLRRQRERELR